MDVRIIMNDHQDQPRVAYKMSKALPIKFKAADLNAKGSEVGIEELHFVHEGLELEQPKT